VNLALLLVLAAAPASQSWKFETDGTPKVSITNIRGSIRVDAADGKTVSVEVTQEGGEAERARFPVEVKQDGDEVSVRLCCGGSCGKLRNCQDPVATHFVVKVPRDASLEVSSVEAPVKVSGVTGEQEVSVVSGDVSLEGSRGKVEVAAVSGNVKLAPEALAHTEVNTVSGNVKLKLPRGAGANVEYSSVGGHFNGREVSLGSAGQRYGNAKHDVEVSTVSGALDVQSDEEPK
jgi:Putative adhesin